MANISISQMNTRAEANLSDLHEVAYADSNSQTGYASGKMTMEVMANAIVNDFAYQSLGNKTVKGAIEDAEVTVDTALDTSSNNPIANSPVATAIQGTTTATTEGQVLTMESAGIYAEDVSVGIEPIQDLHGYDYPWVGGAGKNILPMTVDDIKAINTDGTWSGNTYTILSCTVTIMTDDGSNVTGFKINNAPTGNHANFYLASNITLSNDCVLSGGLGVSTIKLRVYSGTTVAYEDAGYGANVTAGSYTNVRIVINEGYNANNTIIYPMIRLATVTDATFAPYSNICPITGYDDVSVTRTGVNVWDEVVRFGYYDNAGEFISNPTTIANSNSIKVAPNTTCYFVLNARYTNGVKFIYRDINKNYITYDTSRGGVLTIPNNCYYMDFSTYGVTEITTYNNDISINYPSTITTYQPYQGQTYTVSFNDTVYSGTLDVTTGVLVVDKAMVDLGDLSWSVMSGQTNTFYTSLTNAGNYYAVCSQYRNVGNQPYLEMINGTIQVRSDYTYIRDNNYTDATTFTSAMDGVQLLYELATPQTIQLTPQQLQMLKGYNTVTTDANGGMTIKYQPDNVVGELKKLIYQLTNQ